MFFFIKAVNQRGGRRDGRFDVKSKIGIAVKRLEIKGFKTRGGLFRCCLMPGEKKLMETYPKSKNGRVVATLLIKG